MENVPPDSTQAERQSLPVLPSSGKLDRLRDEAPLASPPPVPPMHESAMDMSPLQRALESSVVEILRTIYDPEIPLNIYDLGLIYRIDVDMENNVTIRMTLTSPACPVAGSLPGEVQKRVESIEQVKMADVVLVWEPAWDKSRLSEAAMLDLGLI
jgi:FeS assembly SUF system protein